MRSLSPKIAVPAVIVAVLIGFFFLVGQFTAPVAGATPERFVVAQGTSKEAAIQAAKDGGFVKNRFFLSLIMAYKGGLAPGGYKLSKSMGLFEVADVLSQPPYMKWVTIPEGLRKEEIADLFSGTLGWSEAKKSAWIATDTAQNPDYFEGVYFPDTYLIPVDDTGAAVAARLIEKFNEKFSVYGPGFQKQDIKWTTALKIASLVQRESAGPDDMPIIAGIIWNRLDQNMPLDIDATLQYARGNAGAGWWAPITVADKKIESPYNSYLHKGLPPHPIANPGLTAIAAVLKPAETKCLFYLHDQNRQIHCSETYAEHLANIKKYLSN